MFFCLQAARDDEARLEGEIEAHRRDSDSQGAAYAQWVDERDALLTSVRGVLACLDRVMPDLRVVVFSGQHAVTRFNAAS
jgi:hypothetical protein